MTWSDAFSYDGRSNLVLRTDARGVKTNFSYSTGSGDDPLNRLQGISYDKTGADTTYTIADAPDVSIEYMTTGDKTRVKKVITSGVSTEENAFDTYGRVTDYTLTMTSRPSYPFVTSYLYDTASRLTEIRYPAAYGMSGSPRKTITPSYDYASRLSQMDVDSSTYLNDVVYNTANQVTSLKTGYASSYPRIESYSYDSQTALLTGQTVKDASLTTTYMDLSYTYARGSSVGTLSGTTGQLTKIADNLDHNRDKVYEFDALGRIMNARGGVAAGATGVTANWTQSYSYDRYGNKTATSASGVDQNSTSIIPDGITSLTMSTSTNRITTSGWEFDLAGNMVRGQNDSGAWQRFEYDSAGRQTVVKDDAGNPIETYTYGASRNRLKNETSAGRTYYAWGGSSVVAEYVETGAGTSPDYDKSYIYAGSRLLMTATKATSTTETQEFHHPDRLGTQLVTNGSTGSSFRQTTFPFGTTISAETTGNSNQVFTSYDRSASTGLDYAINRTFSPGEGRFTQVDPLGMGSTSPEPQSLNLYSYTQNSPTDFIDPSGLMEGPPREGCKARYDKRTGEFEGWICPPLDIPPGDGGTWGDPEPPTHDPVGSGGGGGGGGAYPLAVVNKLGPCAIMANILEAIIEVFVKEVGGESNFADLTHDQLDEVVKRIDEDFAGHYLGHPANSAKNIADLSTTFGRGTLPDRVAAGGALGSSDFRAEFQEGNHDQTHHFAMFFSLGINGYSFTAFAHSGSDSPQDSLLSEAAYPIGAALNDRLVHGSRDRAREIRNVANRIRRQICK